VIVGASLLLLPCPIRSPLGTVGVEPVANEQGEREIWIDEEALNKLDAMRGPGEN
jgi:hypothetical protein